ncbi:starch-binding domain-containing protein 1 [Ornithorhynchus anatinus]|uniref:Starch-binding domain-containing protein 1 n=1 Tax=Ornithorhynchus anatinus TaxID=9258 RepID=A0A6I8P2N1_ORNAN|nr:starch-binding domain-containing protein 1 [Ornithorhynchus anatinus]
MGAVWSALLLGGLAGALLAWLGRGGAGGAGVPGGRAGRQRPPPGTSEPAAAATERCQEDRLAAPAPTDGSLDPETPGAAPRGPSDDPDPEPGAPSVRLPDPRGRVSPELADPLPRDAAGLATGGPPDPGGRETGSPPRGREGAGRPQGLTPKRDPTAAGGGGGPLAATGGPEPDPGAELVPAAAPTPRPVSLRFRVHYVTRSAAQRLAVAGDHRALGAWEAHVPLRGDEGGFWSRSLSLPGETRLEWKFVVVEDGKVVRWEEGPNRRLDTGHQDAEVWRWWGRP